MIIPRYWAESRLQHKARGKQITVRRWGWSDSTQEEAQSLAEQRAREAMERIERGENLRRREIKDSYGSEDGVPIREEVVARHGGVIVTRNSYGSLCLNTPNVLFADVDAVWRGALSVHPAGCLVVVITGVAAGFWLKSFAIGAAICLGVPWLWSLASRTINKARRPKGEMAAKQKCLEAIRAFAASHPHWHLRVYETPAGYRLLAMHDVFDPRGEAAKSAFEAMNADGRFANLCALQSCFRARVSPKYWRTGYRPDERLPKTKWPWPAEESALRQRWAEGYNAKASCFASCRFIERMGSAHVHPEAEAVRAIHDDYCRSSSQLPLA